MDEAVLQNFCEITLAYPGNPNSTHELGRSAKACLNEATRQIAGLLNVQETEIIYTSGASESNNLAIKGAAEKYKKFGKHIISTYLEHSSVTGALSSLEGSGYEIDYVDITEEGLVDLEHLEELLREDTILVSICCVDSEVGLIQPIDEIGNLLKRYPKCIFHVDATQAVCKIPVSFEATDLVSFAPHKFYGLTGSGVLIKKEKVILEPLIHGGISTTLYRSGTPPLGLITSTAKALFIGISALETRYKHVEALNKLLQTRLKSYPCIRINSNAHSLPHILNLSILGAKAQTFIDFLDENAIYLSSKSACCAINSISRPVYALTKDKKASLSTLRVSLSHLTTLEDIEKFLDCFDACYKKSIK